MHSHSRGTVLVVGAVVAVATVLVVPIAVAAAVGLHNYKRCEQHLRNDRLAHCLGYCTGSSGKSDGEYSKPRNK